MTRYLLLISVLIFSGSCNSSSDSSGKYPDQVELTPPEENLEITKTTLHIRSVEVDAAEEQEVLVIKGDFPNACTKLLSAAENPAGDSLEIQLTGWQPQDECAQMITPFTFLIEPDSVTLSDINVISVNNVQIQVNRK